MPHVLQAVATETVEAIEATSSNGKASAASNGNGNSNVTSYSNGNGNGSSNLRVVLPAAATAAAAAAAPSAAAALASSNGAVKAATAAPTPEADRVRLLNTIDEEQNAEAAGQLELAAATAYQRKDRTAAGTPYKAPGGNWSKFKTYSVWQVGHLVARWHTARGPSAACCNSSFDAQSIVVA